MTRPSALDLSLCSASMMQSIKWKVIPDPLDSDHLPILISIPEGKGTPAKTTFNGDLTMKIDWQKYTELVAAWLSLEMEVVSPSEEYYKFSRSITECALRAQKGRTHQVRSFKRPPIPWWDSDCQAATIAKRRAFAEFCNAGSRALYEKYKALERKCKNLCKAKKRGHWRTYVNSLDPATSLSSLWKKAKSMRAYYPANESESHTADWLKPFARKICPDFAPERNFEQTVAGGNHSLDKSFTMVEFSLALMSSKNSAPGRDNIKIKLIQNLPDLAKKRLLHVLNNLFSLNIIPPPWREVRVVASLKNGKPPSDHTSYRPIAMLSCLRKLLERMLLFRLEGWLEENNHLSNTQYGFRKSRSTNDCLALLTTEIELAHLRKQNLTAVFLDIQGAFDSVSPHKLCKKLELAGIGPKMNRFLFNLLSEKTMFFDNGHNQEIRSSFFGLPQGSCLSPILYNFYTNDINACLEPNCNIIQFADDGVLTVACRDPEKAKVALQATLNKLENWANDLGIRFSPRKTEQISFCFFSNTAGNIRKGLFDPKIDITLYGETINKVESVKYLGVWFDKRLRWDKHIVEQARKCSRRVNFLRTVTGFWWGAHPIDILRLYKTTILSVLEYGSFCFHRTAKTRIKILERIQYRCLRMAMGCMKSTHNMSLEVMSGVMPLKLRMEQLALRYLIRASTSNPQVVNNFERLQDAGCRSKIMETFRDFVSLHVVADNIPRFDHTALPEAYDSILTTDTSFREDIDSIPHDLGGSTIPAIFKEKYSHLDVDAQFYTDGSSSSQGTGCAYYNYSSEAFYKLEKPCSIFIAELAAIFCALTKINTKAPGEYFIFTDSLSAVEALKSVKAIRSSNIFVNKILELLCELFDKEFRISLIWIPAHCGIPGNEKADALAKKGVVEGTLYNRPTPPYEFLRLPQQLCLSRWQQMWETDELGRFLFSITPQVSLRPWFSGLTENRAFIRMMSRLRSNHFALGAHLHRIDLAQSKICGCGLGFHDVDHLLWACAEYEAGRPVLIGAVLALSRHPAVPIRDILAAGDFEYLRVIYRFAMESGLTL
uniref:Reverse transcriptase domain-containing protein n=1 Tax=Anopheles atroparvus TaxID=41427 RepID=A0AAG5DGL5_ANOAO